MGEGGKMRYVQDCQQRLSSAFDLLLIFLCSLIQTLTPNNALLVNLDMYIEEKWESIYLYIDDM